MPATASEQELKLLRDTIRSFVTRELQPIERLVDEQDAIPPAHYERLRARAVELGLLGLAYPVEYGGSGLGAVAQCVVREEFGKSSDALRIACTQGPNKMILAGTDEQKDRYLRPAIRGECLMAFAVTEPDAGSDVASMRTPGRSQGRRVHPPGPETLCHERTHRRCRHRLRDHGSGQARQRRHHGFYRRQGYPWILGGSDPQEAWMEGFPDERIDFRQLPATVRTGPRGDRTGIQDRHGLPR